MNDKNFDDPEITIGECEEDIEDLLSPLPEESRGWTDDPDNVNWAGEHYDTGNYTVPSDIIDNASLTELAVLGQLDQENSREFIVNQCMTCGRIAVNAGRFNEARSYFSEAAMRGSIEGKFLLSWLGVNMILTQKVKRVSGRYVFVNGEQKPEPELSDNPLKDIFFSNVEYMCELVMLNCVLNTDLIFRLYETLDSAGKRGLLSSPREYTGALTRETLIKKIGLVFDRDGNDAEVFGHLRDFLMKFVDGEEFGKMERAARIRNR